MYILTFDLVALCFASWVLCDHIGTVGGLGCFAVGIASGRSHYVCPFCCTLCSSHQCDAGCASSHLSCQLPLTALHHICPHLHSCRPARPLQFHGALCSCRAASTFHDHFLWFFLAWSSSSWKHSFHLGWNGPHKIMKILTHRKQRKNCYILNTIFCFTATVFVCMSHMYSSHCMDCRIFL